jgi:hypothetical protein
MAKAGGLVDKHGDKIENVIEKAEDLADRATGGRFHDKIEKAGDKAKEGIGKLAREGKDGGPPPKTTP